MSSTVGNNALVRKKKKEFRTNQKASIESRERTLAVL